MGSVVLCTRKVCGRLCCSVEGCICVDITAVTAATTMIVAQLPLLLAHSEGMTQKEVASG
jgi:hypothetical protein